MRRGVNVGNVLDLDAPVDQLRPVDRELLAIIADAGFDTVRIPVRWSAHTTSVPPFVIDRRLFSLVDDAVDAALALGLAVIINAHHDVELNDDPMRAEERFIAGWSQIAAAYADHPAPLALELLNEPDKALTPTRWNALLRRALATVRRTNPDRTVLIGPAAANSLVALDQLELPDDAHVVATVHYYDPFGFTHQGAPWLSVPAAGEVSWGDPLDVASVRADMAVLRAWADRHGAVFVGEFGTYQAAPMSSRARWTTTVRKELDALDIGWCYWDFATDFGAFDLTTHTWRAPLLHALLDP